MILQSKSVPHRSRHSGQRDHASLLPLQLLLNPFLSMTAPVGLFGKGITSSLVFGVIAASSSSAVRRNSFSAFNSIMTGVPFARYTWHIGYITWLRNQYFILPGSNMARMAISIASLPPTVTRFHC